MSLLWKAALLALVLLALAVIPSYTSTIKVKIQHEQYTDGYDWRQPANQY